MLCNYVRYVCFSMQLAAIDNDFHKEQITNQLKNKVFIHFQSYTNTFKKHYKAPSFYRTFPDIIYCLAIEQKSRFYKDIIKI